MRNHQPVFSSRTIVVFDTETTGLYPESGDEVVELAAEKLVGGVIMNTFHALLRPSRSVPKEAVAVHGLTDDYLRQFGQEHSEVFPRFAKFIEEAVLVGHNIRRFDVLFLFIHFKALGLPGPANEILDTLDLARARLSLPNYKLGTVANHFGISTNGAHRAAADVAITREILLRFQSIDSLTNKTAVLG